MAELAEYVALVDGGIIATIPEDDDRDPLTWAQAFADERGADVVVAFIVAVFKPGDDALMFGNYFGEAAQKVRTLIEMKEARRAAAAQYTEEVRARMGSSDSSKIVPWIARDGNGHRCSRWGANSRVMQRDDPEFSFENLQAIGDIFLAWKMHPRWGDAKAEAAWRNDAKALYMAAAGDLRLVSEVVRTEIEANDRKTPGERLTLSGPRSFVKFVEAESSRRKRENAKRAGSFSGDEAQKGAEIGAADGATASALAQAVQRRRG